MSNPINSRWGALSGIAFAVLYVVIFFSPLQDLPEGAYSDQRVVDLYADAGWRTGIIAGSYLTAVAGLCLLRFLVDVHGVLRRAEGERGSLATLALAGGLVYVAMLFAAGAAFGVLALGAIGEAPQPVDPALAKLLVQLGFSLLLVYGLFAAIALVLASSVVALRTAALPRWLAMSGFVVAPLLALGTAYMPQLLVPLWVLGVSVTLLRGSALAVEGDAGLRPPTPTTA